jgi:hypothetical protein
MEQMGVDAKKWWMEYEVSMKHEDSEQLGERA